MGIFKHIYAYIFVLSGLAMAFDVRSTAPGGLQREKERLVCAKRIPYSHLS